MKSCNKRIWLAVLLVAVMLLAGCPKEPELNTYRVSFYEDDTCVMTFNVNMGSSLNSIWNDVFNYTSTRYAGFYFDGWYDGIGNEIDRFQYVDSDLTFYARYKVDVNFYLNKEEGETKDLSIRYTIGSPVTYTLTGSKATWTDGDYNYTFLYWSTDKDATPAQRAEKEYSSVSDAAGTVNLYAIYSSEECPPVYTVNFYKNPDEIAFTKYVEEGQKVPSLTSSERGAPCSFMHLLYWSESRETEALALENKFTIEEDTVTRDMDLYGIYAPEFYLPSSNYVRPGNTSFKIQVDRSEYWTLADGTIAGIEITCTKDGEPFDLEYTYEEIVTESYSKWLLYSYDLLEPGNYVFAVSNGSSQTITGITYTVYGPAPVTGLQATADDSHVLLTWTKANGYDDYVITVMNGTTQVAQKSVTGSSVDFYGLPNDITYTFIVTTAGSEEDATVTAKPEITVKTSDWVVAMYMDGDNNLNDVIYIDLNEVEYGLYKIRDKTQYDNVTVVALWDGWNAPMSDPDDPDDTDHLLNTPATVLYELGTDSGMNLNTLTSSGVMLSSNTKNLSYTAIDWMVPQTGVDVSPSVLSSSYTTELNMGREETLENFLKWVKAHYSATKGIILQFSDHGGGPRNTRYVYTEDGRAIKLSDDGRRALCWDESSQNNFLKTADVSTALTNAGFTGENKADMILMDVCLGSSIEDAYQFRNNARYLAASPNTIPGWGMEYTDFMMSFTKGTSIEAVSLQLVKDYEKQYHTKDYWDWYAEQLDSNATSINDLSQDEINYLSKWSDLGIPTLTITDLSKVEDLATDINELAQIILDYGEDKLVYYTDDTKTVLVTSIDESGAPLDEDGHVMEETYTEPFKKALGRSFLNYTGCYGYSMYYMGSFTWLVDIADFADSVIWLAHKYGWNDFNSYYDLICNKADAAILYSWRDYWYKGYSSRTQYYLKDMYAAGTSSSHDKYENFPFGLTISGATIAVNGQTLVPGTAPDFYGDLEFGNNAAGGDSSWYSLLKYWFNDTVSGN